jgi:hypothetical protein
MPDLTPPSDRERLIELAARAAQHREEHEVRHVPRREPVEWETDDPEWWLFVVTAAFDAILDHPFDIGALLDAGGVQALLEAAVEAGTIIAWPPHRENQGGRYEKLLYEVTEEGSDR